MEIVYPRVAAIDVGKKIVAVAVRTPGQEPGQRQQQLRKFKTFYPVFYPVLQQMVGWLVDQGVTHVAMEATGVSWRPVFHALCEAEQLALVLVNARHVKHVPGRKTDANDANDAEWLAELCEVGLLRGSFIPLAEIAAIREVTRDRKQLTEARTSELQRLCKVLEDGGVKIDSVASSITTVSARAMVEALIAGERDPRVLPRPCPWVMRNKLPDLAMALAGRFGAHHALLARMHLDHIDHLSGMIGRLDTQIEQLISPFAEQLRQLPTIPGIAERTAQVLISEIGVDMSRFPTADHLASWPPGLLASWAGLCPGTGESAGKHRSGTTRSGTTRKGNREVREALVEAAWAAGRTATYLGARFRRLHRRFGKQGGSKTAVAIAHDLIVIVWHVLHDGSDYHDLGADYFTRHDNPDATKRRLIRELQALGYAVDLTPAA